MAMASQKTDTMILSWERLLYLCLVICFLSIPSVKGVCELPERWRGGWFQSGIQEAIYVTRTEVSVKGDCVESKGEKYIFRDKKLGCHRCVVISEKHPNILQYKETLCEPIKDANVLCPQIPGDALLFSLFRRDAPPTSCPLKGPLTFSYSQGHGLCSSPPSTIDSCTSDSRLLFKYQACPDVLKTESSVEEVECIGHWKEGSTRYFVGKVHSRRAQTDEDRYRCFAWERTGRDKGKEMDYRMAQSGDATCNGVFSAYDGSRTLQMKKVGSYTGCEYPPWVSAHHRWHALDTGVSYSVSHRNTTLKLHHNHAHSQASESLIDLRSQARLVCALLKESSREKAVIVAYSTTQCVSGYVCAVFYRRDNNTIEIQQGTRAFQSSDACQPPYFNSSTIPHTTLTSGSSPHTPCPFDGVWSSEGNECPGAITHLQAGCKGNAHSLQFFESCQKETLKHEFTCHGSWTEGEKTYLVISPEGRSHRLCLVASLYQNAQYHARERPEVEPQNRNALSGNHTLVITTHAHSCPRQIVPPTTTINVSFTTHGSCLSLSSSPRQASNHFVVFLSFSIVSVLYIRQLCFSFR